MIIVLDTNVFLSGHMLPDSIPGKIIQAWQNAHFDLALSEPMLNEFSRVLGYSKIKKRLNWDQNKINQFILLLRFKIDIVSLDGIIANVPADPDDDMVLATYIASKAEYLISGDNDLLNLSPDYTVISLSEFVKLL